MKRGGVSLATVYVLGCLVSGCGGGDGPGEVVSPPQSTQVRVVASPNPGTTGYPVAFTITASNSQTVLTSVSIDFTRDGTWDEAQSFNQSSITATFTHTYVNAGTFTVLVEVQDANSVPTSKTASVTVAAPTNVPVTYDLAGGSSLYGNCMASGPPATCVGCGTPLPYGGSITKSLASFPHGASVSITQAFTQDTYVYVAGHNLPYTCHFVLTLKAGTPGSEVAIGSGQCNTQSSAPDYDPSVETCSISVSGVVP